MDNNEKIQKAIELGFSYGDIDGAHHKMWVIDQMIRILSGDHYDRFVKDACLGEDGANTYSWDEGVAP